MIRALWIAKTGLDSQQTNVDTIAHNLANVNTTGYKRERAIFEDLIYQAVRHPGSPSSSLTQTPTGLMLGTGVRPVAVIKNHTQGTLLQTGNAFDMAINGKGFFQVLMPDGQIAYTRDGNFQINAQGQVVNANGYFLQPAITVPADMLSVTITKEGLVTANQPQNVMTELGRLNLALFMNPPGLKPIGENLYLPTAASGDPQIGDPGQNSIGTLAQTFVENSNVNIAEELVTMIQAQRAYEMNAKVMTTADQMLQKLSQVG